MGKKSANEFRMRHVRKFDGSAKQEARETMGMAIEQISASNETAAELSKVSLDADGRLEFVERVLIANGSILDAVLDQQTQPAGSLLDSIVNDSHRMSRDARLDRMGKVGRAILDGIVNSPGCDLDSARNTMWGAVNGVTFYTDHEAPARSDSNRLMSAWFGQNEQLKQTALQVAVEMAGQRSAVLN